MRLRATESMKIQLGGVAATVAFEAGEEIRTEISTKFRRETIEKEFDVVGLEAAGWWQGGEDAGCGESGADYGLVLGVRH